MRRLLAAVAGALLMAGCGSETCSPTAAQPVATNADAVSCSLAPGADATIQVRLCADCQSTSAGCQAEFVGNHFELAPTVQACANYGCDTAGCNALVPYATCRVTVPASLSGAVTVVIVGQDQDTGAPITVTGTVNVTGGDTSCTL